MKTKSKKMSKSTFAIIIMAIAMVAMLAFGGTYAYFTATTSKNYTAKTTTAKISLKTGETTEVSFAKQNLLPGENTSAAVTYTDESTRATYIFIDISTTWKTALVDSDVKIELTGVKLGSGETATEITTKVTEGADDTAKDIYYIANGTDGEDGTVTGLTKDLTVTVTVTMSGNAESVDGADASNAMANEFTVTFVAKSIQQAGFANAQAAWDALNV